MSNAALQCTSLFILFYHGSDRLTHCCRKPLDLLGQSRFLSLLHVDVSFRYPVQIANPCFRAIMEQADGRSFQGIYPFHRCQDISQNCGAEGMFRHALWIRDANHAPPGALQLFQVPHLIEILRNIVQFQDAAPPNNLCNRSFSCWKISPNSEWSLCKKPLRKDTCQAWRIDTPRCSSRADSVSISSAQPFW